jgi:hypothetical protein
MPEIPALGRLRQENQEFEASLDYIARSFLRNITSLPQIKDVIEVCAGRAHGFAGVALERLWTQVFLWEIPNYWCP